LRGRRIPQAANLIPALIALLAITPALLRGRRHTGRRVHVRIFLLWNLSHFFDYNNESEQRV
jgi:hypothetical protein